MRTTRRTTVAWTLAAAALASLATVLALPGGSGAVTKACQVQVDGKEGDMPCVATREGSTTFGRGTVCSSSTGGGT